MSKEYDAKKHEYKVDGIIYPSVNQILKFCGIIDTTWYTEGSAEKGHFIHDCLNTIDNGVLPIMLDVDTDTEGYIDAYSKFKEENKDYRIINIEERIDYDDYQIAGRPDRECELFDKLSILDFKTGQKEEWHALQMCGYKLIRANEKLKLYLLYLKNNGKYKLAHVASDFKRKESYYRGIFISAMNVYKFKH